MYPVKRSSKPWWARPERTKENGGSRGVDQQGQNTDNGAPTPVGKGPHECAISARIIQAFFISVKLLFMIVII